MATDAADDMFGGQPATMDPVATEPAAPPPAEPEVAEEPKPKKERKPINNYTILLTVSLLCLIAGTVLMVKSFSTYNYEVGPGRKVFPFSMFTK